MSPALSKVIEDANLKLIIADIEDARQQINSRPDLYPAESKQAREKEAESDRGLGEWLLPKAIGRLRQAMYEIGRACALDPEFGAKADANEGTFNKLFAGVDTDLDRKLLAEPAAVEAFREGVQQGFREGVKPARWNKETS